jgi:hypothetical protein
MLTLIFSVSRVVMTSRKLSHPEVVAVAVVAAVAEAEEVAATIVPTPTEVAEDAAVTSSLLMTTPSLPFEPSAINF